MPKHGINSNKYIHGLVVRSYTVSRRNMEGACTRNLSLLANSSPHTFHICGMPDAIGMLGEWCRRASPCGLGLYPGQLAFIILPTPSSASLPQPFPRLSCSLDWHRKFFTSQPVFLFSFLPLFFFFLSSYLFTATVLFC